MCICFSPLFTSPARLVCTADCLNVLCIFLADLVLSTFSGKLSILIINLCIRVFTRAGGDSRHVKRLSHEKCCIYGNGLVSQKILWLIFKIEPNLCVLSDHPLHKLIQSQHDLKSTVATPQNHRCSNIVKRVPFPCPVWERWHGSPNRTVGISPRHAVDIAFECYLRSCACVSCAADKCVRSIWNRSNEFFSICGFPIRSA